MDQLQHECPKCGAQKEKVKDTSAKKGWRMRCVACRKADNFKRYYSVPAKERRKKYLENYDPEAQRRKALWQKFKITPEDWDALYEKQGGVCWICEQGNSGHRWDRLMVDHCHKTGAVRGLLCSACNTGLGKFEDEPIRLQKAMDYLNGGNRSVISAVLHSSDEGAADGGASDSGANADPRLSRIGA